MIRGGIPKAYLMDGETMQRVLTRMAHQIMEQEDVSDLLMVGIRSRGVPLAKRLADIIERNEGVRVPVGELDITMYRDDMSRIGEHPEVSGSSLPEEMLEKARRADAVLLGAVGGPKWDHVNKENRPERGLRRH